MPKSHNPFTLDFGKYVFRMFLSEVDHDKYPSVTQKWRFELVEQVGD